MPSIAYGLSTLRIKKKNQLQLKIKTALINIWVSLLYKKKLEKNNISD